ncbi:MAG: hypothetical protein J6Y53_01935 [Alphaproteobacteria bacterium]|nr:hypothetical protein [Alphaproteobacteria bacterium]
MGNERYFERKRGLPGLLRQMFLFLTYPFRHWGFLLLVLIVLAAMYCVPVFWYKVPQNEVVDWYRGKYGQIKQIKIPQVEKKGTDELVYVESPAASAVGRRGFGQAGEIQRVDVLRQEADDVVEVPEIVVESSEVVPSAVQKEEVKEEPKVEKVVKEVIETEPKKESFVYKKGEYKGLSYLDEPVKLEGNATIVNANELMIDNTYVFLYGIYVNPRTEQGVKTSVILKKLLNNKKVVCNVLAYTKNDKTATAECFADGDSINQFLIEKGYSEKVVAK